MLNISFLAFQNASSAFLTDPIPDNWETLSWDEQGNWLTENAWEPFQHESAGSLCDLISDHADTIEAVVRNALNWVTTQLEPPHIEEYKVVALSTGHLQQSDVTALDKLIVSGDQMILKRNTGYFLKLLADDAPTNYRDTFSEGLRGIIDWALGAGYLMIEFDADALKVPQFPVYEW